MDRVVEVDAIGQLIGERGNRGIVGETVPRKLRPGNQERGADRRVGMVPAAVAVRAGD